MLSPLGRKEKVEPGAAGLELNAVGFYEIEHASGARSLIAANVDSAESDLTSLDPDELQAAIRPAGQKAAPAIEVTALEASARQTWWRLALLAVILLMVAETVLGNAKGQKATS